MAITQVGSATTGGADSSGSFSVTKPTGVASGHVLVAMGVSNEGTWDTLPSGFTQFAVSSDAGTPNNFRAYFWYKICGGSEPASYSFGSTTAAGAGAPMVAIISAWSGVDTSGSPIMDQSLVSGGSTGEPANPATSFTQTADGRLFFFRAARAGTTIQTFSQATANWTELADDGRFSGGTVSYAGTLVSHDFDTAGGVSRSEPGVSASPSGDDTDNVYLLGALRGGDPSEGDSGTGSESESFADIAFGDSDSGTGSETEVVGIPIAESDSGAVSEAESVNTQTVSIISDNFNRANEAPLNVSTSGHQWTSLSAGALGVVSNECKKTA